jgi:type IV pilus assembly protein PilB
MLRAILPAYDVLVMLLALVTVWAVHAQLTPHLELVGETPDLLAPYLLPLVSHTTGLAVALTVLVAGHVGLSRAVTGQPATVADEDRSSDLRLSDINPNAADRLERVGARLVQRAEQRSVSTRELVDDIIIAAHFLGASDLHIEPKETTTRLWFRIDGVMRDVITIPKPREAAVVNRIRVLAHLEIAKKEKPQDGRIDGTIRGRDMNLRVSIFPTLYGPKVVVRLLDAVSNGLPSLGELGINPEVLERFRRLIHAPQGMVLFTGPTGSGKTTLMYAAMCEMLATEQPCRNIVTLEDPIERALPSINQTQIENQRGLSFATGLRTILRQDPNVIMVGEIRDGETAEIALRAGQTGHLIFTTLHTNSAASAFGRLIDMGIQPFLLASAVTGVVSIRLVRRICGYCRDRKRPPDVVLRQLPGPLPQDFAAWEGAGCDRCQNTGFIGRTLVFELLEMNEAIAQAVVDRQPAAEIQRIAQGTGMLTLMLDGMAKVQSGDTSVMELLRVVG